MSSAENEKRQVQQRALLAQFGGSISRGRAHSREPGFPAPSFSSPSPSPSRIAGKKKKSRYSHIKPTGRRKAAERNQGNILPGEQQVGAGESFSIGALFWEHTCGGRVRTSPRACPNHASPGRSTRSVGTASSSSTGGFGFAAHENRGRMIPSIPASPSLGDGGGMRGQEPSSASRFNPGKAVPPAGSTVPQQAGAGEAPGTCLAEHGARCRDKISCLTAAKLNRGHCKPQSERAPAVRGYTHTQRRIFISGKSASCSSALP